MVLARAPRVQSVDLLRGIVMVIMALDHVRDFMSHLHFPPEDLQQTNAALFFTRWITHFCAPSFFFLAGTGIYLMARSKIPAVMTSFLWKRGLWLIVLEATIIFWGWTFLFPIMPSLGLLVIWALGWAMIWMALFVRLPWKVTAALALIAIFGHNLLDGIPAAAFGKAAPIWGILHVSGFFPIGNIQLGPNFRLGVFVLYPWIPWVAVTAAGYTLGRIYDWDAARRRRFLLTVGAAATVLFIVLRATNLSGNAQTGIGVASGPFVVQPTLAKTIIAFLNVEKYPPSLQFLLMTLGPALVFLGLIDGIDLRARSIGTAVGRFFQVFGKVPMFYYILHLYLAHIIAIVSALAVGQNPHHLYRGGFMMGFPQGPFGFNLPAIYLAWAICVGILYFPCRWYAEYKATHKQWWLSYL